MDCNLEAPAPQHAPATDRACPACGAEALNRFFGVPPVPVNAIALSPTREAALACPRGEIELAFCGACGLVTNVATETARVTYDRSYDNSLHFSPTFQAYADELADHLVSRFELRGKDVIDVGCGNGEFLALVCARGGNRGVGFDPSFIPGRIDPSAGLGVSIVEDYYSDRYQHHAADLLICRQVLEHIAEPRPFLAGIARALEGRADAAVFFEVPNGGFVFRPEGMWDVIYEHCTYYTAGSLTALFATSGFEVLDVAERFNGQYLSIEARPGRAVRNARANDADIEGLRSRLSSFVEARRAKVADWQARLDAAKRDGKRAAIWGAGAKCAMLLNALPEASAIECVVDINPHKWGSYMPGTGHQVVSPEFLKEYRPDTLLIMNGNYREEIGRQTALMGLRPELVPI